MPCLACGKAASRSSLIIWRGERATVCSDRCLDALQLKEKVMEQAEKVIGDEHLNAASDAAGEYLACLQKSDFAALTEEEWMTLLAIVVHAWADSMNKAETPF